MSGGPASTTLLDLAQHHVESPPLLIVHVCAFYQGLPSHEELLSIIQFNQPAIFRGAALNWTMREVGLVYVLDEQSTGCANADSPTVYQRFVVSACADTRVRHTGVYAS